MTLNACSNLGMMGPLADPIPSDPRAFHYPGYDGVLLCSQLGCAACGERVAHASEGAWRRYTCACASHLAIASIALGLREERPDLGLPAAWACAGHPVREPPATVGEVYVSADPGWADIITALFRQPLSKKHPRAPVLWLRQAYGELSGERGAIDAVIAAMLRSDDAVLRGQAVHFLWWAHGAPPTDLLPELLRHDSERLRAQPDQSGCPDLYAAVLGAVALHLSLGRWPYDDSFRELLRSHALEPQRAQWVGWFLARHDRTWFQQHADALAASSPEAQAKITRWRR